MLAYVFWHQPLPGSDRARYETALLRFHQRLVTDSIPGTLGSRTMAISDAPWLPGGGYEDWYFLDGFAALGVLNAAAVDPAHGAAHDTVAALTGFGSGGLYALVHGKWTDDAGQHVWLSKPRDLDDRGFIERVVGDRGSLWRRQMVLGPAPEFCLVSDEVPVGLGAPLLVISVSPVGAD